MIIEDISKATIKELREAIVYHAEKYYEGEEEISDDDFDLLTQRLSEISPNDSLFETPGWGYKPDEKSSSNHLVEIKGFDKKLRYPEDAKGYLNDVVIMPKFDGLTIEAYYQSDLLFKALTRGDGATGKVHTTKIKDILKDKVHTGLGDTYVRGEVIVTMAGQKALKDRGISRVRNRANGILKRDDNADIDLIDLWVYTLNCCSHTQIKTKIEAIEHIKKCGFNTTPYKYYEQATIDDFIDCYSEWSSQFPIDGIIICKNNLIVNDSIIEEDAIAYKFNGASANVEVSNISVNTGTTGKVTPVVWFKEKVELCDCMIEKATGHNMGLIYNRNINIGSVLKIIRSGDVIPYIIEVVQPSDEPFMIDSCPICGHNLEWTTKDDGTRVNQFCRNDSCGGKVSGAIYKFLSIVGVPKGLGSTYLDNYIEATKSSSLTHFIAFHDRPITANDVVSFGPHFMSLIQEMITNIQNKIKSGFTFSEFWYFINIPDLGNTISSEKLYNTDPRSITKEMIEDMYNNKILPVHVKSNIISKLDMIVEFANLVHLIKNDNIKVDITMQVAVTGKTSTPRKKLEEELKGYGIKVGGVSKKTTCVVCNEKESDSDKFVKAKQLGIPIISEEDFRSKYL